MVNGFTGKGILLLPDVHSPVPLCPTQLLTMKSKVVIPPLRKLQKEDRYMTTLSK